MGRADADDATDPPPYATDPDFAELIGLLPTSDSGDVLEARRMLDEMLPIINAGINTSELQIEDQHVPGPTGAPDVLIRTYMPDEASGAGLLYIHGGGFTVGSIESEHARAAAVAREVRCVVVSVDYRLAPEHPFPAGLYDCYAVLEWLHDQAESLGIDRSRIGVSGSSAGGGLAAALALLARDRGGPALCFQCLGIPELDDRLSTGSMRLFVDTPIFNRPGAEASWRHYLGPDPGEVSYYAAPARATDLSGLPPAYVSTMEFDPLRDEGMLYAMGLLAVGVSCELHSFPRTFHGSAMFADAEVSQRESNEMMAVLRKQLG